MKKVLFYIPTSFTLSVMFLFLYLHFTYGGAYKTKVFVYLFYASIPFFPFLFRKLGLIEELLQVKFSPTNNLVFGGLFVLAFIYFVASYFNFAGNITDWMSHRIWLHLFWIMLIGISAEFVGRRNFENDTNFRTEN